jgi:hypothetical protein
VDKFLLAESWSGLSELGARPAMRIHITYHPLTPLWLRCRHHFSTSCVCKDALQGVVMPCLASAIQAPSLSVSGKSSCLLYDEGKQTAPLRPEMREIWRQKFPRLRAPFCPTRRSPLSVSTARVRRALDHYCSKPNIGATGFPLKGSGEWAPRICAGPEDH